MLENFFKYIDEKEVKKNGNFYKIDTFNKLGYKAKINTHITSYIN